MALGADGDDVLVIDGGHGTAHAVVAFDLDGVGVSPNLFAVVQRKTADRISQLFHVVVDHIHTAVINSWGSVAFAKLDAPEFLRTAFGPLTGQFYLRDRHRCIISNDSVDPCSAKSGPGTRDFRCSRVERYQRPLDRACVFVFNGHLRTAVQTRYAWSYLKVGILAHPGNHHHRQDSCYDSRYNQRL